MRTIRPALSLTRAGRFALARSKRPTEGKMIMATIMTADQRKRAERRGVRFGEKIIARASTQSARADESVIAARIRADAAAGIPWQPWKGR